MNGCHFLHNSVAKNNNFFYYAIIIVFWYSKLLNMKTKKSLLLLFFVLGATTIYAQDATTSSGGDATGVGGSSSYSVGQVVYTDATGSNGSVNQGVQQPYTVVTTGVNNNNNINLLISVFPNPSITSITLNVGNQELTGLSFNLYDVQGKLLLTQKINSTETSILMNAYDAGNYILKVLDSKSELKSFKIIKN